MSKEKYYWKWKNTIIDFKTISDEKDEYSKYMTKKDLVFHYLGTPDEDIHEWYNGGYSSEYNTALRYAKELGLVEDYVDYEEIRYQLQQKENIIKEVRELAIIKKARVENEPDYSKSYLEGYENAIQTQHLSHSGVMLETIKSTIKTTCNDFLEILDKESK